MLAQSFKSAAALGLEVQERDALVKVLGMFERNEIQKRSSGEPNHFSVPTAPYIGFNMSHFFSETDCGTVACICGWAIHVGGLDRSLIEKRKDLPHLNDLFDPSAGALPFGEMAKITPAQAARALRSYLTTGDPNWDEAVA